MGCLVSTTPSNPIYQDYNVHERLGSGTFATVRRIVRKKEPHDEKALKITSLRGLKLEEVDALRNEVDILSEVEHKHVVQLYEHHETDEKIYMVQDLLRGGELFDRIIENVYFSEAEAAKVVAQIADALVYLHKRNIVHRDLKPENLLLTDTSENYDIKIIDFGLAKKSEKPLEMPCGTPGYVAPEILKRKKYHKPVDIWSLGVITYILLCGFPPFHDDQNNLKALYKQIRKADIQFPQKYWGNISMDAKNLIRSMLEKTVRRRITAEQLLDAPWIKGNAPSEALGSQYITNIRRTNTIDKMKRAVRVVMGLKKLIRMLEKHTGKRVRHRNEMR